MTSESTSSKIAVLVVASVLSVGALWALSRIPGLLHWLLNIGVAFWSHLKGTSRLPNWGLYLLVVMATHTLITLAKRFKKPKGPKVTKYNQDTFLGVIWRWSFTLRTPTNIWAFCPACDTQLVYTHNYEGGNTQTILTCETCNRALLHHNGDKDYLVQKIHRQIDRKIRTGEWTKLINQNST